MFHITVVFWLWGQRCTDRTEPVDEVQWLLDQGQLMYSYFSSDPIPNGHNAPTAPTSRTDLS
jgi:hypothetical protein